MRKPKPPEFTAEDALRIPETVHMVTDRIRTGWSNVGKKKTIAGHFEQVRVIKNLMAKFAFAHLPDLETPTSKHTDTSISAKPCHPLCAMSLPHGRRSNCSTRSPVSTPFIMCSRS